MRSLTLLLLLSLAAAADEVELASGEIITDCRAVEEGDRITVTARGITRTYSKSEVRSIKHCDTLDDQYRKQAKELAKDDLAGHLKLARWCVAGKLADRASQEYKVILGLDPDQEEARAALGFTRHLGQWMTEDELKLAQGLVKHKGKWMTPEQRDLEVALDVQKDLDRKFAVEVAKWVDRLDAMKEADVKEAKEKLAGLDDRYKVKPYLGEIRHSKESVRRFVVEELLRIKDEVKKAGEAVQTQAAKDLARRALWDTSEPVRGTALDALRALDVEPSWSYVTPALAEDSSVLRRRAEDILARLGNAKAAPPLLDLLAAIREQLAFITQYEKQIAQILKGVVVLKDGQRVPLPPSVKVNAGTLDAEAKKKLTEEQSEVIRALGAVTGQDFGEDVAKWESLVRRAAAPKVMEAGS